MPKLNLNVSVLSDDSLVKGIAHEKFIGPTGEYQSSANPNELLISLSSKDES